ncbi:abhydrolase domain-containing protein 8-like [Asbolus verrucosus]|uniref:acylglycerol lipase n=1 Tax=Asbolus verrucosus TaxID=1661398 RepID=A0A482W498_ASBVE|nr:abhydrolase domain-containing protein 8-like [Asbolus verrucosus]
MTEEQYTSTTSGCFPKVVNSWQQLLSLLNIRHPVYPLDPIAPENSEFFLIDSKIRIRVIHIAPESIQKPLSSGHYSLELHPNSKRSSLSEEYWFTKWNKPLKIGNSEDEDGVVLRKKHYRTVTKQPNKNSVTSAKATCLHKKQKKPFIILFHGIGNTADVWWSVINSLAYRGYEVIAPDMLGHGYSSTPDRASSYTFHNLLIHAITIFDHYTASDDKRKCILIGHSYGCSLISALYRHRASQIAQLILISGGGPTPLAAPVRNNEISPFGCVHTLFKPLLFCGLKRSFLFSSRGKHFDSCDPESAIPPHILEYISRGQNWPEGDAAFHRRILVPTLLVHGLQDTKVTLVQQCEMERTIPRAFLELIPNAGHMSMLETPEHLSHMILCFIDTWN